MPEINCPTCGRLNPVGQETCQFCLSPLPPPVSSRSPDQPADARALGPAAAAERFIPKWLREERRLARGQPEDSSPRAAEGRAEAQDLLAGLHAQRGDDNEERADWLERLAGTAPRRISLEAKTEVNWPERAATGELPPEGAHRTVRTEWPSRHTPGADRPTRPAEASPTQPRSDGLVYRVMGKEVTDSASPAEAAAPEVEPRGAEGAINGGSSAPDWLLRLQAQQAAAEAAGASADHSLTGELEARLEITTRPRGPDAAWGPDKLPEWLAGPSLGPANDKATESGLPEWLEPPEPEAIDEDSTTAEAGSTEMLLASRLGAGKATAPRTPTSGPREPEAAGPARPQDSRPSNSNLSTTSQRAINDPLTVDGLDHLFIEMPDWLSGNSTRESAPSPEASTEGTNEELPAALPGWVRKMRPGGAAKSPAQPKRREAPPVKDAEHVTDLREAFSSLPGGETSRPKAYAIKLQASTEQQAHAALLDQVLEAEDTPQPMALLTPMRAQRGLRWAVAGALWIAILGVLLGGTELFRLPSMVPSAAREAVEIVQSMPDAAPVLVVIEYAPARTTEMEAAAAPLLDQMILLRHPRLTFISTSPTGSLLAERIMQGALGERGYRAGVNYSNLGYLPGGALAVLAFAQDPMAGMPLDVDAASPWNSMPLRDVRSLSDFAALVILADGAEVARTWIEQTSAMRGSVPMLVVSSAQAAPMIHPYYEARQILGLVTGLRGGATLEQNNAGRPGSARTYWDAFSLGLLLTAVLLAAGATWNLTSGIRTRLSRGDA